MKSTTLNSIGALGLSLGLIFGSNLPARAQGTAITYQGRLDSGGVPYTGPADFQFSLWNAASAGSQVGSTLTLSGVGVTNGLFTVTLDFGNQFPGADRWLEIAVRTNLLGFITLSPRQKLTATPYAVTAGNVTGTIPSGALGNAWQIGGNAGTTAGTHFVGTTDDQPLELKVNGVRALRLEPHTSGAPNVIGGAPANSVAAFVLGATIGGGGALGYPNQVQRNFATVGGGMANTASGYSSTVAGGVGNTAGGDYSTVGGGGSNTGNGPLSTVGGGRDNTASGWVSTVGGGDSNAAGGDYSTVGGGGYNTASGDFATVPGGVLNSATNYAFAAGRRAKANHRGAFVWADSTDSDFASSRNNQFNLRATGGVRIDTGSGPGIALNAAETPIITRGWDPFGANAPGSKQGHGRWGLFIEPSRLVAGIPGDDLPGRYFHVAKYDTNGNWVSLLEVRQNGNAYAVQFNNTSSREVKENFRPVDGRAVLERVAGLEITRWNYKGSQAKHLGPVAEDFWAAFGLGEDDQHIATGDLGGVALAAIQGLNQKVESVNQGARSEIEAAAARIQKLESENVALRRELLELKELIRSQIAHGQGGAQ